MNTEGIYNCADDIRDPYLVTREDRYCVYKITSPSGLVYIGSTCNPKCRIKKHLDTNIRTNPYMDWEVLKYSPESMSIEIIKDHLTRGEAMDLEKEIIKVYPYDMTMNIAYTNKVQFTGGKRKQKEIEL